MATPADGGIDHIPAIGGGGPAGRAGAAARAMTAETVPKARRARDLLARRTVFFICAGGMIGGNDHVNRNTDESLVILDDIEGLDATLTRQWT